MSEEHQEDKLLESNYDGIQEYDNDLPKWWLYLFYITILFGVFYVGYYHFGPGVAEQPIARLERQMEAYQEVRIQAEKKEEANEQSPEELLKLAGNTEFIQNGNELYKTHCVACHLDKGQGLVGPNLTDQHWIHGGEIEDIRHVIEKGVVEKGMLAWDQVLSREEIRDLTLFVWSIRNTNIEGKAPEGELVEE